MCDHISILQSKLWGIPIKISISSYTTSSKEDLALSLVSSNLRYIYKYCKHYKIMINPRTCPWNCVRVLSVICSSKETLPSKAFKRLKPLTRFCNSCLSLFLPLLSSLQSYGGFISLVQLFSALTLLRSLLILVHISRIPLFPT